MSDTKDKEKEIADMVEQIIKQVFSDSEEEE